MAIKSLFITEIFVSYYLNVRLGRYLPKYVYKSRIIQQKMSIFASSIKTGVLAQLARALDWQSKGDEFETRTLHGENLKPV